MKDTTAIGEDLMDGGIDSIKKRNAVQPGCTDNLNASCFLPPATSLQRNHDPTTSCASGKNHRINSPRSGSLINHYVCGGRQMNECPEIGSVRTRATRMNYRKRMTDQLPQRAFDTGHKEQRTRGSL